MSDFISKFLSINPEDPGRSFFKHFRHYLSILPLVIVVYAHSDTTLVMHQVRLTLKGLEKQLD